MQIVNPPVEVTDNLLMLATNEYPLFLYKGGSDGTLIEGGIGAMGPILGEQLESLGIAKDFVRQVVITHGHPDHVMAVPLFRELFPGVSVLASEMAAKTLSTPKAVSFFSKISGALADSLLKAGIIADRHIVPPHAEEQIAVDRVVKEGDTITLDSDVSLEIIASPGHSDCGLAFHEPGGKMLFISDATGYYLPEHDYWWPNYFVNYQTYLDSMERLAGLNAEILCLGHNAVIKGAADVKKYFSEATAATKKYHERIVELAKAGKNIREIAEQLGSEVYEKKPLLPLDFFQKNCGLLVKQSLKHEGMSTDK